MKKIVITGGPTNEAIDEVMKITNMSTGSLSTTLSELFLNAGYRVTLILNNVVNSEKLEMNKNAGNLKLVWIENTQDMLDALERESREGQCDFIIHASAVGDYKADYTFLMEDLVSYVWSQIEKGCVNSEADLLEIMLKKENYQIDNSSKISSYQKNLTVKLGLTPKIISNLRKWYPDSVLIGCKLLENVSKEELYGVATKLCNKNQMDYIFANDLADLRNGMPARYLVSREGYTGTMLDTPKDIFEFVNGL